MGIGTGRDDEGRCGGWEGKEGGRVAGRGGGREDRRR